MLCQLGQYSTSPVLESYTMFILIHRKKTEILLFITPVLYCMELLHNKTVLTEAKFEILVFCRLDLASNKLSKVKRRAYSSFLDIGVILQ